MNKQFIAVVTVVILGLVGLFAFTGDKKTADNQNGGNNSAQASNHTVGAGNKKVTLTEYGDFECPACKQYYPLVKAIKEQYKDDITFQFRHFPLTQIHKNAMLGSRAAEAAGKQNKFFEMHDFLYENQDDWSKSPSPNTILETFATQLGLNIDQFKADMMSAETAAVINADLKAGHDLKANSTPTFAINGQKIDNPKTLEEFKKLIDDEIAKASSGN